MLHVNEVMIGTVESKLGRNVGFKGAMKSARKEVRKMD